MQILSEEAFKRLNFCSKLGYINRLLCTMCRRNKIFPVLFLASMVTRLYYVMFSTFWVLYLTSCVGEYLEDDAEVSKLYAKLMIISVVIGLAFSPFIGMITDKVSPLITLPFAFSLRAISILLFCFIVNPTHIFAFAVGSLLVLGTTCEQICSDVVLMRNAEKEIRGVIYGTAVAMGYAGQLVLCLAGGWLFDNVGPKTPFYFVGILDITFAIFVSILGCCGVIENDIELRKKKVEEDKQKLRRVKEQMHKDKLEQSEKETLIKP